MKPTEIRAERNLKRQAEQYVKDQEDDYSDSGYPKMSKRKMEKLSKGSMTDVQLKQRERELSRKIKERDLSKREREFKYPSQTYAKKRATAFAGHFLSRAQDVPEKAKGEISKRVARIASSAKAPRISRVRYPHEPGQSTRLPVFAPSTGMGAGVAEETSRPAQPILQQQQQPEFFSQKTAMDFFGNKPQQDILGTSNKYDLGLGSSNGNKKKKEVRYY
jgi:hypothetical protein